jgi:hypothetical protein
LSSIFKICHHACGNATAVLQQAGECMVLRAFIGWDDNFVHQTCCHLPCIHKIHQTPLSSIHKNQHDAFKAGEGTILPLSCKIQGDGCAHKTPTLMSSCRRILSGQLTWHNQPVSNSPVNDCTSIFSILQILNGCACCFMKICPLVLCLVSPTT